MSKPLVVFISIHDWANSTYEAVQAINHVGEIDARHIVLWEHPWQYPHDLCIPVAGSSMPARKHPRFFEAMDLLNRADLVHLWNCEWRDFSNGALHGNILAEPFPVPVEKVKSCSYTGSQYRKFHSQINPRLRGQGLKLAVQDPCFHWPDEIDETFIPHAVNTDELTPLPIGLRDPETIGCYNPGRPNYDAEIRLLRNALDKEYIQWKLVMDRLPISHRDHLKQVARCRFFFQSVWRETGTFGRSALEACSMGVPTFSMISDEARQRGEVGGFDDPAIIHVTEQTLEDVIAETIKANYDELSHRSRQWVIDHYSYPVVGRMYTEFFRGVE